MNRWSGSPSASPRTRGSTQHPPRVARHIGGFPAHAGIDPSSAPPATATKRLPPRTRGSTSLEHQPHRSSLGFPAHAGIDPGDCTWIGARSGLPRARGDRPVYGIDYPLGVTASPRTRGSTLVCGPSRRPGGGFPAHAGIDPRRRRRSCRPARLPRARGDRPAGEAGRESSIEASPRTRGSTLQKSVDHAYGGGFPAHAGIDPTRATRRSSSTRLPRARGDRPLCHEA